LFSARTELIPRPNPMRILIAFLITAILALPLPAGSEAKKSLGMWVWANSSFVTDEARQQLVAFCAEHRITHLDVHADLVNKDGRVILKNAEALQDLIALAGQRNITTAVLRGSPKMFFSENHEQTLRELRALVAFSETLPRDTQFRGIKYDVEPYCTKEWKTGQRPLSTILHDYLALLRKARSILDEEAARLWLAVDMPFWWDKDKFVVEFEGKRKRINEHVQDLTDFATIMSYRRSSQKVLECVEEERRYAQRIGKVVFPSLETVKLKQDSHVSFWEVPNEEFWKVVPELLKRIKQEPAIGGLMIHCYRSLLEKSSRGTPEKPAPASTE
jgi:hypothetical protein